MYERNEPTAVAVDGKVFYRKDYTGIDQYKKECMAYERKLIRDKYDELYGHVHFFMDSHLVYNAKCYKNPFYSESKFPILMMIMDHVGVELMNSYIRLCGVKTSYNFKEFSDDDINKLQRIEYDFEYGWSRKEFPLDMLIEQLTKLQSNIQYCISDECHRLNENFKSDDPDYEMHSIHYMEEVSW